MHVGRFAGTDIEYLAAILSLLAAHIGLKDQKNQTLVQYGWLIVNLILLFIPGLVWLVFLNTYWQRGELFELWDRLQPIWNRICWIIIATIGIGALVASFVRSPKLIIAWLGAPSHLPSGFILLKQLANTLLAPIYRGPNTPELWLGRLPLLDAFLSLMLVAGIIFYIQNWRAERPRILGSFILLGVLLISLGGAVRLSIIVPLLYVVIVAGIAYVLRFWLKVFPFNPVARRVGIGIVGFAIALSCLYNLQQYFVAWPSNPDTTQIYQRVSP